MSEWIEHTILPVDDFREDVHTMKSETEVRLVLHLSAQGVSDVRDCEAAVLQSQHGAALSEVGHMAVEQDPEEASGGLGVVVVVAVRTSRRQCRCGAPGASPGVGDRGVVADVAGGDAPV